MTSISLPKRWACAGSYDPITNGHLDVIERAIPHCDELVVAITESPVHKQKGLLDTDERVLLAKQATAHLPVKVVTFSGLMVKFAQENNITGIVRGLRTVTDFEYEFEMSQVNHMLDKSIETFYISCDPRWSFCSSSTVRQLHHFDADFSSLVPACVGDYLKTLKS